MSGIVKELTKTIVSSFAKNPNENTKQPKKLMNTYVNNINNECKKRFNVKNKFDENERTFAQQVENDPA